MAGIKYYLVMNPSSRSGRGKVDCKRIVSEFNRRRIDFDYKMTQGSEDAIVFSSKAIKDGWDVIVAVGGDGTICEVISGFFNNGINLSNRPMLGVLHVGTSPDFNRYHNIPVNLDKAIDVLVNINKKTRIIDIGKVSYLKSNGDKASLYFGSNVNIGLGPFIASKANARYRKYLGDFLGTLCSAISSLFGFKGVSLKVKIDEQEKAFSCLLNLTIGKDPYLASGMRVFNEIKADDGRFYILTIEKKPIWSILCNLPKLYVGNFLEFEGTTINYGKKVEVECALENMPIEFDGDTRGYLPAKIEIIPKALEVITG